MPGPFVPRRAAAVAAEAIVVTYPLVLMDLARNSSRATDGRDPAGTRQPVRPHARFPLAASAPVVTRTSTPLTSSAWADLSAEPLVLSLPDTAGRYYAMPMYDAWTTAFATLGARTTGTRPRVRGRRDRGGAACPGNRRRAGTDATGPGSRPPPLRRTTGPRGGPQLQQQIRLTPLKPVAGDRAPTRAGRAARRHRPSPVAQVARMDPREYFTRVARLLADNPPHRDDRAACSGWRRSASPRAAPRRGRPTTAPGPEIARGMAEGRPAGSAGGGGTVDPVVELPPDSPAAQAEPLQRAAPGLDRPRGLAPRRTASCTPPRSTAEGAALSGSTVTCSASLPC